MTWRPVSLRHSSTLSLVCVVSNLEAAPTKKKRRTVLEPAAVGSLDIRDCLQRASPHDSPPAAISLSLRQQCALLACSKADLLLASDAWQTICRQIRLLYWFRPNLNLLPPDFRAAFDLPSGSAGLLENVSEVQLAVQGALRAALCWWSGHACFQLARSCCAQNVALLT